MLLKSNIFADRDATHSASVKNTHNNVAPMCCHYESVRTYVSTTCMCVYIKLKENFFALLLLDAFE